MKKIFLSFIFLLLLVLFRGASFASAASLSLSPTTGGAAVNGTFDVNVNLDTGGVATTGVDAIITFNASYLQVTSVSWGPIYGTQSVNPTIDNTNGKLALHPGVTNAAYAFTGQGVVAIVKFSGKAAGTATVGFTCTPVTTSTDSNVWSGGNDVISCTANTGGSYTITSGGASEPTATPTTGAGNSNNGDNPTATTTPGKLLESGVTEWTFLLFALGIFFTLGGIRLLFSKRV